MSAANFGTIGNSHAPDGKVTCRRCGKSTTLKPGDVGRYIRGGWPACCDQTMMLELGGVKTSNLGTFEGCA